jgi:hypothetical protein
LSSLLALALLVPTARVSAQEGSWSLTGFAGRLTDQHWEQAILPWKANFIDSGLVGFGVGRERALRDPRFSLGFEAQIVRHFGQQDHWEANLPVVIRYRPKPDWPARIESIAFGIGLSHSSKVPQVEIDIDGNSRRTLIYWMGELEFDLVLQNTTLITRIHHRSDAFGLLPVDAGSNGLVIGFRRRF